MLNLGIANVELSNNGKFYWIEFVTGHLGSISNHGIRKHQLGYYALPRLSRNIWQEYDALCEDCAKRGIAGKVGDALPLNIASDVMELVNDDPEAFEERVRLFAYALQMESHGY